MTNDLAYFGVEKKFFLSMMDSTERSQLDHLVTSLLVSPMGSGGIEFGQICWNLAKCWKFGRIDENFANNIENLAKMLKIWPSILKIWRKCWQFGQNVDNLAKMLRIWPKCWEFGQIEDNFANNIENLAIFLILLLTLAPLS